MAFSDYSPFRVGDRAVMLARRDIATALTGQGRALTADAVDSGDFTADGNTVANTVGGYSIGEYLYVENDPKQLYEITGGISTNVFISPSFQGTTGTYSFRVFAWPVSSTPVVNGGLQG